MKTDFAKRCIVTGGAGFVGSALVRRLIAETAATVLVVDKLTYAGVPESLRSAGLDPAADIMPSVDRLDFAASRRLHFLRADICDRATLDAACAAFRPEAIFHLAAESHVDRSINGPGEFIQTNVVGTATLLQSAIGYWRTLPEAKRTSFRFQHVSTDEVYGSLGETGFFTERTPYAPHSPYSASKASSDHLVRAWHDTYGLPTLITNCSNNYGPCQFPEKLIPLVTLNALDGKPLPVYGTGMNVRDWLHVDDHVAALLLVNVKGVPGETYGVGGRCARTNLEVVRTICRILDERVPRKDGKSYAEQITFVPDRPGHDLRYAIDPSKIEKELGWRPTRTFEDGLAETVQWYLETDGWWNPIRQRRCAAGDR